ncbi:MAG TPA: PLP-dependent aminotransferase family protein [Ruminiclostridium sp.]|nr:PLP-dependent aminotransferase family protein [Ruminiclostridium sp.]
MNYKFSDRISSLKPSLIREILKNTSGSDTIPFSAGNPSPESFPVPIMKEIADGIFEKDAASALQYGISEGYTPLRDALSQRMKKRFSSGRNFDNLIIVSGGQQGIELACKVLCNEGDTVLCENPSFIGAENAFRSYNVNLKGVELEKDGINIEKLEAALKTEKNVKILYLIPTFQNPMGITTTFEKRKAVYELAKKYGVIIIEDNPYGDLRFEGEEVPTIKSIDTEGLVIYCGSFSKILSAGIRVGYVLAPDDIIQKMVVAKQVSDVHTNLFFQMVAYRFMTQYGMDAHIEKIRALYRRKANIMIESLEKALGGRAEITHPQGGLFLWCTLPDNVKMLDFCKKASEKKVAVVPGIAFCASPDDYCNSIRLNYSTPSDEQIVKGCEILGKVLDDFK